MIVSMVVSATPALSPILSVALITSPGGGAGVPPDGAGGGR